ncbi:hypothetical protein IFM89_002755 [Coptis chinensis]|uniref:Protein kinase domain-containing protein n=1 Tax=Coptis chinensis TaxID=261450 RepID=A0A835HQT1_9MAGN|nr:hypothetical protein IFM89_002755 [Coptis chinensis]
MDNILFLYLDCYGTKNSRLPTTLVFILVFVTMTGVSVCQPSVVDCKHYYSISPFAKNSTCDSGDWGGFLPSKCCVEGFDGYLYVLSQRANHTGLIYFDATEQRNCLLSLIGYEKNIMACGFERLQTGGGGCSDFSVTDVVDKLGGELRSLEEDCRVLREGESDKVCNNCITRWKEMEASLVNSKKALRSETDVCRFAVLVSLTSNMIQDENWITTLLGCLGDQSAGIQVEGRSKRKKINKGLWLLVGGLTAITIMVGVATWLLLKKQTKTKYLTSKDVLAVKESSPPKNLDCQEIPIKEIFAATNNLNAMNFIGQGIAGKVYKGVLANGQPVAVKHIINDGHMETFVREVTSLSHVRHTNLVSLLGYCEEEDECYLVYELCPNGNLSEWLFGKEQVLSWIQRLEIAIDSARGLWFLHTYPEGCIVHRDIKPTNILLGKRFEAKLSDFGLSKVIDLGQSYVSSEVRGTFGYVDPEYQRNHRVNSYGDVYSFGIVLLQLISGKRVINLNLKKPMPIGKMAKLLTRGGSISEFADPKMNGEYSTEAFDLILELALSCTALKQQRPRMEQVLKALEIALNISTKEKARSPTDTLTRVYKL